MRRFALSFSALILIAGCGPRAASVPEKFQRDLDRFISDASRLNALTEQGVNCSDFGNQLATVSADFTIVDAEWPAKHKELTRLKFQTAIEQWKLIYRIWRSQIEHDALFTHTRDELTDERLISEATGYLPDLAKKEPPLSYRRVERALMATAATDFSSAVAEMNQSAK